MATNDDLAAASAAGFPEGWGLRKFDSISRNRTVYTYYTPSGKRLISLAEVERELGWAPASLKGERGVTDAIWAAIAANKSEEEAAADAGLPAGWKASASRNLSGRASYMFTDPEGKRVRSIRDVEMILGRSVVAASSTSASTSTTPPAAAPAPAPAHNKAEDSKAEHSKAEHSKADHSKAEHSKAEHSKAEHSKAEVAAAEAAGLPAGWGLRKYERAFHFLSPSGKKIISVSELEKELGWVPPSLKGDRAVTEAIFAACAAGKSEEETAVAAGFPAGWKVSATRYPSGKSTYSYISPEGNKVTGLRAVEDIIGRPLTAAMSSKPPEMGSEHEQNGTGGFKRKGGELDDGRSIDGEDQYEGFKLRYSANQQDACDILPDDVEAVDLEVIGEQIEASGWKRIQREESHHTFSGTVALSLHRCGRLVVSSQERELVNRIGRQLADTWLAVE